MDRQSITFVLLPESEWMEFKTTQQELLKLLQDQRATVKSNSGITQYLTPKEFMAAIKIRRTKFDELVKAGKIKAIKKLHKIYIPTDLGSAIDGEMVNDAAMSLHRLLLRYKVIA